MTWARVVQNEIVEIFEEDPAKYFHPDLLHEWVDIPDEGVHVGWKLRRFTYALHESRHSHRTGASVMCASSIPNARIRRFRER